MTDAELFVVGEIAGGHDFGGASYFCVFEVVADSSWSLIEGRTSGCTHIMSSGDDGIPWSFPVDVHFSFSSVQSWPKIAVQVWQIDSYGRKDIAGYGTTYLPMPLGGEQEIEISTWKPVYWTPSFFGRLMQTFRLFVMGGYPVLRDNTLIHRSEDRFKLHTIGTGTVRLRLNVLSRGMRKAGLLYD